MSAPPSPSFDAPRAPIVHAPTARRTAPTSRTRRRAAAMALPVVAAAPASADYAYTGECRVTYYPSGGGTAYRKFRARVARSANGGNWALTRYDYTYTIDPQLEWGPHSDERIDVLSGYVSGANPWHSPDNHTSNETWVAETGWKATVDHGSTELKFHAWFDVPSDNDPECNTYTPVF